MPVLVVVLQDLGCQVWSRVGICGRGGTVGESLRKRLSASRFDVKGEC